MSSRLSWLIPFFKSSVPLLLLCLLALSFIEIRLLKSLTINMLFSLFFFVFLSFFA